MSARSLELLRCSFVRSVLLRPPSFATGFLAVIVARPTGERASEQEGVRARACAVVRHAAQWRDGALFFRAVILVWR